MAPTIVISTRTEYIVIEVPVPVPMWPTWAEQGFETTLASDNQGHGKITPLTMGERLLSALVEDYPTPPDTAAQTPHQPALAKQEDKGNDKEKDKLRKAKTSPANLLEKDVFESEQGKEKDKEKQADMKDQADVPAAIPSPSRPLPTEGDKDKEKDEKGKRDGILKKEHGSAGGAELEEGTKSCGYCGAKREEKQDKKGKDKKDKADVQATLPIPPEPLPTAGDEDKEMDKLMKPTPQGHLPTKGPRR